MTGHRNSIGTDWRIVLVIWVAVACGGYLLAGGGWAGVPIVALVAVAIALARTAITRAVVRALGRR